MMAGLHRRCAWLWVAVLLAGCAGTGGSMRPDERTVSEALPLSDPQPGSAEPLADAPKRKKKKQPSNADAGARGNPLIDRALGALGTRYRYGGNAPDTGFDCSGFIRWVYQDLAAQLPRSAYALSQFDAIEVQRDALKPADLVFFRITRARSISHVGMYMGNGQFIHAPSSGGRVRIDSLNDTYWRQRLVKARRWITPRGRDARRSS